MTTRGPSGWDARYADTSRPWPAEPSSTVVDAVRDLPAGTALDAAAGTGRHALWLARQGWTVTAVDFSAVGLEHGRRRGGDLGICWTTADLTAWEPDEPFDWCCSPTCSSGCRGSGARRPGCGPAAGSVVGHALRNLTHGVHGPRSPELLHTEEQLRAGAQGLEVERLEEVLRRTTAGPWSSSSWSPGDRSRLAEQCWPHGTLEPPAEEEP
jgi:SAM-dependent methyltransferase